jgi:hypothetical protein
MHWLLDNFTNEGYGTLHNADFGGAAAWTDGSMHQRRKPENSEVMQMDATMGFLSPSPNCWCKIGATAFTCCPSCRVAGKRFLRRPSAPKARFSSALQSKMGKTVEVRVKSEKGGRLRLHPASATL